MNKFCSPFFVALAVFVVPGVFVVSCSSTSKSNVGAGGASDEFIPNNVVSSAAGGAATTPSDEPAYVPNPNAFPSAPIFDDSKGISPVPVEAAALFGDISTRPTGAPTSGPCLIDPAPESLFPYNWIRPRFYFEPVSNENLFEIRLEAQGQNHVLVAYTTSNVWRIPSELWKTIASGIRDVPIQVSIWGATYNADVRKLTSPLVQSVQSTFTIAPVSAAGSVVYWRTRQDIESGELKGFKIGEENVALVMQPAQVEQKIGSSSASDGTFVCIGCHTSTPDGEFIGLTAEIGAGYPSGLASGNQISTGKKPDFLTKIAEQAMNSDGGPMAFSAAHWRTGDRIQVGRKEVDGFSAPQLVWIDLEAKESGIDKSFGVIRRENDTNGVWTPTWTRDGKRIAYTSSNVSTIGNLQQDSGADIYMVDYNDRKGGLATPVPGAAQSNRNEYYPSFSPDSTLLTFTVADATTGSLYNQSSAKIHVVPAAGGTSVPIAGNEAATCAGKATHNSWPKWSPEVKTVGNKAYYWLTFSSQRSYLSEEELNQIRQQPGSENADRQPQIYVSAVVVEGSTVHTYPALYLWNQPPTEANHTPAWDVFQIPPAPPAIVR